MQEGTTLHPRWSLLAALPPGARRLLFWVCILTVFELAFRFIPMAHQGVFIVLQKIGLPAGISEVAGGILSAFASLLVINAVFIAFESVKRTRRYSNVKPLWFGFIYVLVSYPTYQLSGWMQKTLGLHPLIPASQTMSGLVVLLFPFLYLFIFDFFYYWFHRSSHYFELLWRVHIVHHSIENVSSANSYHHIFEEYVRLAFITIPVFLLIEPSKTNILFFSAFTVMWSQFVHTDCVLLSLPSWLRPYLADNVYHHRHHSIDPKHYDKNFVSFFPIWDKLFGTQSMPEDNTLLPSGVIGVPEPESAVAYVMTPITGFTKGNKPMPHRGEAKNSDIEVMRALAIILAVIHHLNSLFIWDGAWKDLYKYTVFWGGVDLFFCISGFVIARSLSNPTTGMGLRDFAFPFWIKRIWRIWPAAIFWVVTATLMSKSFNHFGAFGNFVPNVHDTVATLLQVANFHYISCYTFGIGQCGNQVIYWSLSLEEQFYLLLPLLLFFFSRKKIQWMLVALIAVSFFIPRPIATPFWFVRLDAIAYGVLIAFTMGAPFRQRFMPSFMNNRVTSLAVTLALIAAVCIAPAGHIPIIGTGLLAMICAAMVFIASYDNDWLLPVPYLRPLLLYIGSRSFAIYLVHNPSFWITRELFGRLNPGVELGASYTAPFLAIGIALIFILAELTYRVIERPMREKGRRIAHAYRTHVPNGGMMMQLEPVHQRIDM